MSRPSQNLMPVQPPAADEVPEHSTGRILTLDEVESATVRQVVDYWRAIKGQRRFPSRADFAPRDLKRLLRHVTLLRVVNGGADYEFRILGDVQVQAYGESFVNQKLSDVAVRHPRFAAGLKIFYDGVRMGRDAFGYRGWIGRDMPDTKYAYHEIAFFPLGPSDDTVDHILVAGVYVLRGYPLA
jgi:PAS domain-containing protein